MGKDLGKHIKIPVCEIEFYEGGRVIWIHSPKGATVMRICINPGSPGVIKTTQCDSNPVSHTDIIVEGDINICLAVAG